MELKDRIEALIESKNISSSIFAEKIGSNKGVISHILNGRNKPSLDIVQKILSVYTDVNPYWLLYGSGNMYLGDDSPENPQEHQNSFDLFSESSLDSGNDARNKKYENLRGDKSTGNSEQDIHKEIINAIIPPSKKIEKIIIYYDDNTYETFYSK